MRVEVLACDIEGARRRDDGACPIARALERITRHRWSVAPMASGAQRLRWQAGRLGDLVNSRPLPEEAGRFAEAFDRGELVTPFAFDLEV